MPLYKKGTMIVLQTIHSFHPIIFNDYGEQDHPKFLFYTKSIPRFPSHPFGVNQTKLNRSPRNGRVQCLWVHPLNSKGLEDGYSNVHDELVLEVYNENE